MPLIKRFHLPRAIISCGEARSRVFAIICALLFAFGAAALTMPPAFAQTPPPGPMQGTGPWAESGKVIDTWEEYPGGMLLIFNPKWLFQAFPGSCSFSDTAVCYTWKQYQYFSADPYNTSFWAPYARGCMVLGADPLSVGTAAGFSQQTDLHSAGENWIEEFKPLQTEAATNSAAGMSGAVPPDQSLLPSPWTYDRCFAGAAPGNGTVVSSCTMHYGGSWNGQSSDRTNTLTLLQTGQILSVSITAGPVFDDEASFLTDPAGVWSVVFTGNSSFNFVQSTLSAHVAAHTLTVFGNIAGPLVSSTFGLEVTNRGPNGSWTLDTCNISL